jgi:hypothetical protein
MSHILHDPVPLGVAASITIPLKEYVARVGWEPERTIVLLEENERISYVGGRLSEALSRPLTSPGSEGLARVILEFFQGLDVMGHFAEKALQTLRDGERHDRVLLSPHDPRACVWLVTWNGTHREVQAERFGNYLGTLASTATRLVERGFQLAGFLEIDAYLRDNPDPGDPGRPLDEVFEVDIEYSYLPGHLLGSSSETASLLPNVVLLNPDLCSPEENQLLRKFMARQS